MKNSWYKKGLVCAVIVLSIAVAVAPSINANVRDPSVESESVETTVNIYGIEGLTPYTVKMTEQEAIELDRLFDTIKASLDSAETEEEIDEIFTDAVVSLDELGLLPDDMTVEEAQQLVTGVYQNPSVMNPSGNIGDSGENFNCRITGRTSRTAMFDLNNPLLNKILALLRPSIFKWTARNLPFFYGKIGFISLGEYHWNGYGYEEIFASDGWVWSDGSNGVVTWDGSFRGDLGLHRVYHGGHTDEGIDVYRGITDFEGLWIDTYFRPPYFIGNAEHVRLVRD